MATREYSSAARTGRQILASPSVAAAGQVTVKNPRQSVMEGALSALSRVGEQYFEQRLDQAVQSNYLDGQRARMTGQAVDDITNDPFMRPFVKRGYSQQNYQIEQASMVADAQTYLGQEGRAKTPEEFGAWLAERSKAVQASITDDMSNADRVRALQSQAGTEAQLVQAHASAHIKYGQEEYAKRITVGGNAHLTAYMQAVQAGDQNSANSAMGNITEYALNILDDEKLPTSMRQDTVTDLLRATVAETGSSDAVRNLLLEGKLDTLPADKRMQLDAAIAKADEGKITQARLDFSDRYAQFQRRLALGEDVTFDEFQRIKGEAASVGMSASFFDGANDLWYKSGANSDTALAAQALEHGDLAALARTGKSLQEGLDAISARSLQQSGGDPLKAMADTLVVGLRYGTVPKSVADGVSTAIRSAIISPETQTPEGQKMLAGVLDLVAGAQQQDPAKAAVILQGFDPQTQSTLVGVTELMRGGVSGLDALKQTVASQSAFAKASPAEKAGTIANLTKNVAEVVQSEFTSPWYRGVFNFVTGNAGWEENSFVQGGLNAAVSMEARRLASLPQYAGALAGNPEGAQALVKAAAANVKSRGLDIGLDKYVGGVPHSLLTLPQGVSLSNVFGVGSDTPLVKEHLGELVAQETSKRVPSGYAAAYSFSPVTGKLMQTVYSKDGTKSAQYEVDARAIGKKYTQQFKDRVAKERNGEVVHVPDGTGSKQPFTVSGHGPGGLTSAEVIQLRKDLIADEGLRLTVYKDTRGVKTAGVGQNLSALGDDYLASLPEGRRIPASDAQKWFNDSSYKAMSSGKMLANQYGFAGNSKVQAALSKAVFQLGDAGWRKFNGASDALAKRDPVALENSIKGSAWYKQTPKRAQAFLDAVKPELSKARVTAMAQGRMFGSMF